ncbi:MAG: PKD domain-containing protein [Bacteroidia bacterium]
MRFFLLSGLLLLFGGGEIMPKLQATPFSTKPDLNFTVSSPCLHSLTVFEDVSLISSEQVIRRSWAFGDGSTPTQGLRIEHKFADEGSFLVTLSLTLVDGETYRMSKNVRINPQPQAPLPYAVQLCAGKAVQLKADAHDQSKQIVWYHQDQGGEVFFTGAKLELPSLEQSQSFYLAYKDENNCESERVAIQAQVFPPNRTRLVQYPEQASLPVAEVSFGIESALPIQQWVWNFGDGQSTEEAAPTHEYRYPGEYEVSVNMIDENGCKETLRKTLKVIKQSGVEIPTAFSPNGDGVNDFFEIKYHDLSDFEIEIFDLNGIRIFDTKDPNFKWSGLDETGKRLPEGEYSFVLRALDGEGVLIAQKRTVVLIY